MSDLVAELDKVKKDVRSLLISAPNGLTPKMLEKDYAAVMGQPLPYRKFGFLNPDDFFRSLTDILHVTFQHNQILLFGIADKSTEHIMKMVRKQKKPKFYNSITSTQQQPTSSKKKFQSSLNYPTAHTREGVMKVLNKHANGFSLLKLQQLYHEVNGTKLDVKKVDEIPALLLNMKDIAKLDYGKREKSGNNLYVFPSATLVSYQKSLKKKVGSTDTQLARLGDPPALGGVSKVAATTCTISTTVQSWVNSVSSCSVEVSSCTNTMASTLSHCKGPHETKPCSILPETSSNPRQSRFHKLSSTTSSGIMSQTSSSTSGTYSETDTSQCKSIIDKKSSGIKNDSELNAIVEFEDTTPPASSMLKQEIIELLRDCKTEIRSIKVPSLYKKKYGKVLDLHKHGYYSIVELISTMTAQISMCRLTRTGDWLFKLRSAKSDKGSDSAKCKNIDKAAKLASLEKEFKELLNKYPGGIAVDSLKDLYEMHFERNLPLNELGSCSTNELICKIADTLILREDQLCLQPASACDSLKKNEAVSISAPLDAVGYGIRYKPPVLPSSDWGFFDCYVTYVNNPSDFRIQIISDVTTEAFNLLMDDMERTYCHTDAKAYRIPPHLIVPGQICVAIYHGDNNWNRAVIEQKPSGGFVKVRYVDFGDIASVSTAAVYYLKRKYYELPILEVHARLANIRPARSNQWEVQAKKELLDFSKNKQLVARVTNEDDRGINKIFSLEICDVSTGDDIYINDVLLEKRLAILLDDEDDLTPAEIQHIIDQSSFSTKKDIPADSPPPYQATETLPPLVNSTHTTSDPATSTSVGMPPLSLPAPPPGFSNVLPVPRQEISAFDISRLIDSLSGSSERKTIDNYAKCDQELEKSCTRREIKKSTQKEQKRYLKAFRLTEKLIIHVINIKGTALLLSGEISRIFRPNSDDMLAPLLMMKGVHENFAELVLANNEENAKLFTEFEKMKVKDAFKRENEVRSVVTLHRLTDIPEMISELGHVDHAALKARLSEIISLFDPDNPYWYRDASSSLGSTSEESSIDSCSTACNTVVRGLNCNQSTFNQALPPLPGLKKLDGSGDNVKVTPQRRLELTEKRDALFQQFKSTNYPSIRVFNDLKDVMKSIDELDGEEKKNSNNDDKPPEDLSFDLCAIPTDQDASVGSVFSEIRQSCDLNLSVEDGDSVSDNSDEISVVPHRENSTDTNFDLKALATNLSAAQTSSTSNDLVDAIPIPLSVATVSNYSLQNSTLSVKHSVSFVPSATSLATVFCNSTLSVTNAVTFVPTVTSLARTKPSLGSQSTGLSALSMLSQDESFNSQRLISSAYSSVSPMGFTLHNSACSPALFSAGIAQGNPGWPANLPRPPLQTVISLSPQTGMCGFYPFYV